MLVEQLPQQSRTKTAMRNELDPFELAAMSSEEPRRGWGPHSYTDELICRLGESVDRLGYLIVKTQGGNPKMPPPWRRPGVLGPEETAEQALSIAAPVLDALEAERAEREARRRAKHAQQ